MPIFVTHRQIVVPGELLAEGKYEHAEGIYIVGKRYYSKVLGLVDIDKKRIRVIPLKGKYVPKVGDVVIGKVVDVGLTNWTIDINSPYSGILQVSEVFSKPTSISRSSLSKILDIGDIVIAKVIAFDFSRDPMLTIKESKLGRVRRGTLIEIDPPKIPRVIGKRGSMIGTIKEMLGVEVIVGRNGRILVVGEEPEREALTALVIKKIESEAHTSGLTDRIKSYISSLLQTRGG